MVINNNGVLINGIKDVQKSTVFTGSIAITDIDGSVIQIPQTEMEKLLNQYIKLKQVIPTAPVKPMTENPFLDN